VALQIPITDIRSRLPRRRWSAGSFPKKSSITLHYNGPPVEPVLQAGAGLVRQLIADANWQMRPGWANTPHGADGLQYHFAVGADGEILQCRDLAAVLWHCADEEGNERSIAIHLPIGWNKQTNVDQHPSAAMLASTERLCEALIDEYGISGRRRVVGHREWSVNRCPGPPLFDWLTAWRTGDHLSPEPFPALYRVTSPFPWVRVAPTRANGDNRAIDPTNGLHYMFPRGADFPVRGIVLGTPVDGDPRWAHHEAQIGFVHISALQRVKE
jgi:hypothetical protein